MSKRQFEDDSSRVSKGSPSALKAIRQNGDSGPALFEQDAGSGRCAKSFVAVNQARLGEVEWICIWIQVLQWKQIAAIFRLTDVQGDVVKEILA
jgi:hypothetical protein